MKIITGNSNPNINLELRNTLISECNSFLRVKGKDWKWLSYAKKKKNVYLFERSKESQFEVLYEVLGKVSKKFPDIEKSVISEHLSELVNSGKPYYLNT